MRCNCDLPGGGICVYIFQICTKTEQLQLYLGSWIDRLRRRRLVQCTAPGGEGGGAGKEMHEGIGQTFCRFLS